MTADGDEDIYIIWRFTVKNGVVKITGTAGGIDTKKILKRDEHGTPFLRLPLPYPDLAKQIEKKICELCGEGVSGEGTYSEEDQRMKFDPEMQS
jgi:hypothetical protein